MTQFSYEAYGQNGKIQQGSIEAESLPLALSALKDRGLSPFRTDVSSDTKPKPIGLSFGHSKLGLNIRVQSIRQLATLLNAGITVDRAFDILASQTKNRLDKSTILKSQGAVSAGQSLSSALNVPSWGFKPGELGLLQAAEKSGSMVASLEDLAEYLEKQQELRSKLTSALVYPAFLLALVPIALTVIALVLVPNIAPLFEETGAEMPLMLQAMVGTTQFITNNTVVILIGVVLSMMTVLLAFNSPSLRAATTERLFKLPVLSRIRNASDSIRLCRALGLVLRGGSPMQNALATAVEITPNTKRKMSLEKVRSSVAGGQKLGAALKAEKLLDPSYLQMIAIGEETNKLDTMLLYIANTESRKLSSFIERLMTLLTPVLTILMGIMVGGIVMSVMRAILSINELATK
jgi:general secretion pathway protein F